MGVSTVEAIKMAYSMILVIFSAVIGKSEEYDLVVVAGVDDCLNSSSPNAKWID